MGLRCFSRGLTMKKWGIVWGWEALLLKLRQERAGLHALCNKGLFLIFIEHDSNCVAYFLLSSAFNIVSCVVIICALFFFYYYKKTFLNEKIMLIVSISWKDHTTWTIQTREGKQVTHFIQVWSLFPMKGSKKFPRHPMFI